MKWRLSSDVTFLFIYIAKTSHATFHIEKESMQYVITLLNITARVKRLCSKTFNLANQNHQHLVFPYYDNFPILTFTSIMICPIVTRSARRVRPVNRRCLLLLGIWSHLYLFRGPCCSVLAFVLHFVDFWDVFIVTYWRSMYWYFINSDHK